MPLAIREECNGQIMSGSVTEDIDLPLSAIDCNHIPRLFAGTSELPFRCFGTVPVTERRKQTDFEETAFFPDDVKMFMAIKISEDFMWSLRGEIRLDFVNEVCRISRGGEAHVPVE